MTAFGAADVTGAVLAGGAGSRLDGRDKGLELLGGRPLVAHVVTALRAQVGRVVLCVNRNADVYAEYGTIVPDVEAGFRGPLAGIASALAACATPWLLTLPVDCPTPPAQLAARLYANRRGAAAAVAHDGTRREPLFALYAATLAASGRAALTRDLAVWRWQDEIGAVEVDFADCAAAFGNLNTATDFRAWENARHG